MNGLREKKRMEKERVEEREEGREKENSTGQNFTKIVKSQDCVI